MELDERYLSKGNNQPMIQPTTPKGIVTPIMQAKKGIQGNLTLSQLLDNEKIMNKLDRYVLPKIEKMNDGEMFYEPVRGRISNMHTYVMKWFSLTKDHKIKNDHSYRFARLDPNGYLMKITIPRVSEKITDFGIDYIIPVNSIHIDSVTLQNPDGTNKESYIIVGQDITNFPGLFDLMRKDSFKEKYLIDAIE